MAVSTQLKPKAPARMATSSAPMPQATSMPIKEPNEAAAKASRELTTKPMAKMMPVIRLPQKNTCAIPSNKPYNKVEKVTTTSTVAAVDNTAVSRISVDASLPKRTLAKINNSVVITKHSVRGGRFQVM